MNLNRSEVGRGVPVLLVGVAVVVLAVAVLLLSRSPDELSEADPPESAQGLVGMAGGPSATGSPVEEVSAAGSTSRNLATSGSPGVDFVPTGFLEGRVIDQAGVPIEGVSVIARQKVIDGSPLDDPPEFDGTPTTAEGEFRLIVPSGNYYQVGVDVEGYAPVLRGGGTVYEARVTRTSDVELSHGHSILGTAVDRAGRPIAGVTVSTNPPRYGVGEARTDATGTFEIRDAPVGVIELEAVKRGYVAEEQVSVRVNQDGSEPAAPFILRRAGEIRGLVIDDRGEPVPSPRVSVGGGGGLPGVNVLGEEDGTFVCAPVAFDVDHDLLVWADGFEVEGRQLRVGLEGSDPLKITLRPRPGFLVVLRNKEDGSLILDGRVFVVDPNSSVTVPESPMDFTYGGQELWRYLDRASPRRLAPWENLVGGGRRSGEVRVSWKQPGTWLLRGSADGYLDGEVEASTDGEEVVGPVEILLTPVEAESRWHGLVLDADGDPVEGALVGSVATDAPAETPVLFGVPTARPKSEIFWPVHPPWQPGLSASPYEPRTLVPDPVRSDANGRFVWEPEEVTGRSFGASYRSLPMSLAPFGDFVGTRIDDPHVLQLQRGGSVVGVVTDAGSPLVGYPIVLWNDEVGGHVVRSGGNGVFSSPDLAVGTWRVAPGSLFEVEQEDVPYPKTDPMVSRCQRLASVVTVEADETSHVTIDTGGYGAKLLGSVTVNGSPRNGLRAWISLESSESTATWSRIAQVGDDGVFLFSGLPPGSYQLSITSQHNRLPYWSQRVELVTGEQEEVSIQIGTSSMTGRLIAPDGRDVEFATVAVVTKEGVVRSAGIRADGMYYLDPLPAAGVLVTVAAPPYGKAIYKVALASGSNRKDFRLTPSGSIRIPVEGTKDTKTVRWEIERFGVVISDGYAAGADLVIALVAGEMDIEEVSPGPVRVRVKLESEGAIGGDGVVAEFVGEGVVHAGLKSVLTTKRVAGSR